MSTYSGKVVWDRTPLCTQLNLNFPHNQRPQDYEILTYKSSILLSVVIA